MREQGTSSTIVGYATRSLGAVVVLVLLAFVSAGFNIRNISIPLAVWGALSLIYGIWKLGTCAQADTGVSAVNDMRGQAGASPLANYTNRQEYKLARLRHEHPIAAEDSGQDTGLPDEPKRATSSREAEARNAACWVIAGVLALGLSWFAGQMFPR